MAKDAGLVHIFVRALGESHGCCEEVWPGLILGRLVNRGYYPDASDF